jgi:hypothetical protein
MFYCRSTSSKTQSIRCSTVEVPPHRLRVFESSTVAVPPQKLSDSDNDPHPILTDLKFVPFDNLLS